MIGYRKVLLICLLGATLTSVPQIFVNNYWIFVAERFAVGLFIGGILPTANALIGRSVSRENSGHDLWDDVFGHVPRQFAGAS